MTTDPTQTLDATGNSTSLDTISSASSPQPPTSISANSLTPTPSIDYKNPNPVPVYPVSGLDATQPLAPTAPENQATDLTSSLESLNQQLVGESDYKTQQEQAQGIDALSKTQTDLSSRLKSLQNEALAIPQQLQLDAIGRGMTTGGLQPLQTAALRNNAIQSLSISSLLEASRGNLTYAQSLVDKAVAQKYDPIKEEIAAKTANLNLILKSPSYSLADKNRAQAQLEIQKQKSDELEKQKAIDTAKQKIAVDAATNAKTFTPTAIYPTIATALDAISNAKDAATATAIASQTGLIASEKLDTSVVEVNGRKVLVNNQTGATVKDLGAVTKPVTTGTAAERQSGAVAKFAAAFVPGAKLPDGTGIVGSDGYINPNAWKAAIADAPAEGITREEFIKQFGYLLNPINTDYGLTKAEMKLVTGVLP